MLNSSKVIIFCDPGVDDALMLLQMLSSSKYEIMGIIPVRGNASSEICLMNTLALCEYIGRTDIKIYPGKPAPFVGLPVYGKDGLCGLTLPPPKIIKPQSKTVIDFVCEILRNQKLLFISTANLTEPAEVLTRLNKKNPKALSNISGIAMMGGVINVNQEANYGFTEANVGDNPKATDSFFDISALHKIPIFLAPLDLTHSVLISKTDVAELKKIKNPAAQCAYKLISNTPKHYRKRYGKGPNGEFRQPLHDLHVSMFLLHPELYQTFWVENIGLLSLSYIFRQEFIDFFIADCKNFYGV